MRTRDEEMGKASGWPGRILGSVTEFRRLTKAGSSNHSGCLRESHKRKIAKVILYKRKRERTEPPMLCII